MPITVPYLELHDGSQEQLDLGSIKAQKKYLIAWSDRWQFAKDVAGTSKKVDAALGTIVRAVPLQYPDYPTLYASGLMMEATGRSTCNGAGNSIYTHCICTVTFSTPDFDYENPGTYGKAYQTISIAMSADIMTLPSRPLVFDTLYSGNPVKPTESPGLVYPKAEITIVSHQIPELPLDIVFSMIGKLNNAVFLGCAIGTVLFVGANQNRQRTSAGDKAWEVEYKFIYRPVDWNKFYSPAPGVGFDFLKDSVTGNYMYNYGNFDLLP